MQLREYTTLPEDILCAVLHGLNHNAQQIRGINQFTCFAFSLHDEKDFIGAIQGYCLYGSGHIDLLFVDKAFRRSGFGKCLMRKAEAFIKNQKCRFITLHTMDFEAPTYYEKQGFCIEYERHGYDGDSRMLCMRKNL